MTVFEDIKTGLNQAIDYEKIQKEKNDKSDYFLTLYFKNNNNPEHYYLKSINLKTQLNILTILTIDNEYITLNLNDISYFRIDSNYKE